MLKVILSLTLLVSNAYAAGDSGIGSLLIPALNFVVFAAIIILAVKGPMRKMFDENAVKVKELFTHAEEKDKEAQIKLDMYEKKMSTVESEVEKIFTEVKQDAVNFEEKYLKEVEEQIGKMTKDAHAKVESEKNAMLRELNASLVDEVIANAKSKIDANKEYKTKATNNLVAKL
ncbi:ATP synthase F0 subunit B [Halobacteriovorax sp. GB3]|uniref:ATP synthase F0 subunit B n=1 Tax=Halobacteriovorax sp. GB3 TaxID=2719615 RepID=UPI00235F2E53|nr:ATP synthase F0 subunit B [Halobacteriovorax sp. GB3]MDD0854740.1 ATP synthase F0 subunit B [Halobacteriovorax sp. GB3]